MPYLDYIDDDILESIVSKVVGKALSAIKKSEEINNDNVIDPFSAVFDSMTLNITLEEWLKREKTRQAQKTLQNAIGSFHEEILGNINGWRYINNVIDIVNDDKKIIAEIKNKHNTTKGSDKKSLYDNLYGQIIDNYNGYTGYYVEIIPKSKKKYDKAFAPSDNMTKINREKNEYIRVIDGKSFYDLASGKKNSLEKLYSILPTVIKKVTSQNLEDKISDSKLRETLFFQAYDAD